MFVLGSVFCRFIRLCGFLKLVVLYVCVRYFEYLVLLIFIDIGLMFLFCLIMFFSFCWCISCLMYVLCSFGVFCVGLMWLIRLRWIDGFLVSIFMIVLSFFCCVLVSIYEFGVNLM